MVLQIIILFSVLFLIFLWSNKKVFVIPQKCLLYLVFVNSTILALACGSLLWQKGVNSPETFTDFIGGFLAMASMGKTIEYHACYLGIIVFMISMGGYCKLYSVFEKQEDIDIIRDISLYSLILPTIMLGQIFISQNLLTTFYTSSVSVVIGLIVVIVKYYFPKLERNQLFVLMLGMFLGIASYYSILLFLNRISCPSYIAFLYIVIFFIYLGMCNYKNSWNKFLVISQFGLPFAFGNLLMPIQVLKSGEIYNSGFNLKLDLVVIILILCSLYMLVKAFQKNTEDIEELIPSLPLVALICMFCASSDQWGSLDWGDDYHNGEIILPWFLFQKFGCNVYVDYIPSRGIVNYIPGFLLWIFKGHDFSYIQHFVKWADLPLYFLGLFILRRRCGLLIAFLGCAGFSFFTPAIGAGLMFGMLAWAYFSDAKWEYKPTLLIVLFFIIGAIGMMYSLTDAVPVFVSMIPLFLFMLFHAWNIERKVLCKAIFAILFTLVVIFLIPSVRKILFEIVNILLLQSNSYTTAHCVPLMWHNITQKTVYYVVLNYGFLFFTIIFAIRLFYKRKNCNVSNIKEKLRFFAYGSLVILGIILIQRAGGRAGCEFHSRVWIASYIFLIVGLPLLYVDSIQTKVKISHILIFSFLLGCYGNYINNFNSLNEKIKGIIYEPENTVNPSKLGLTNLGENTVMNKEHFQHHVEVKDVIKSILPDMAKKGVFWDLTNNSTIYSYCGEGLIPPMSYPSYFYVASLKLSQKMQEQIKKSKPILVLIKGKNVEFHEGNLALRSYYLYTYLLENYRVFSDVYGKVWMILKGHEHLLANSKLVKESTLNHHDILSSALDYKTIDGYPRSWGNSMDLLRKKLINPINLIVNLVDKKNISLLSYTKLSGDFLYLRFNRPVNSKWITVFWNDNFNDKGQNFMAFWGGANEYLIPLFASSNWYLGENKSRLIVSHEDNLVEPLEIVEARLYDRL